MTVVVTGGNGFVGRHLLSDLKRRGVDTVALVRRGTTIVPGFGAKPMTTDLASVPGRLFDDIDRPRTLVHLAWGGLPNYHSVHHYEVELRLHYDFIREMVRQGVRRVVVLGTCLEYGLQSGELREDFPARPGTAYGFAKDSLRQQLELLKLDLDFELVWPRLFFVWGRGQAPTSLFQQLKTAVERSDAIFPMSSGEQLRDFLPIEEAVSLISELAMLPAATGIFNICSGKPVSVRGLVERWIAQNGWEIDLKLGTYPYPDYEPMAFWGSRRRLDSVLVG